MATLETRLETSAGDTLTNPSEAQILSVLNSFGKELEHCNFEYGDNFVSASGDAKTGIHLYYTEAGAEYESEALDAESVCGVFLEAAGGSDAWKTRVAFAQGSQAGSTTSDTAGSGASAQQPGQGASLKDQLLGAAKSEASYGIRRILRKFFRNLF